MYKLIKTTILIVVCAQYLTAQSGSTVELNPVLDNIHNLFSAREYNKVISESNTILSNSESSLTDSILTEIGLFRVKAAYYLGRYKDVTIYGEEGISLVNSDEILKLTDFWKFISPSYIHLKDKPKAIEYLNKTLDAEEQLLKLDPKKVITAYKDLGALYSYFGDSDLSYENYKKGIQLFNDLDLDNTGIRGDLYLNLSANFISSNDNDSAFHYLSLAKTDYLNVYVPTNSKLGTVNYNMAVVQNNRRYVFEAIDLLKETELSWNEAYGENHPRMAYIQINRGQMALKVGDYEKALNSGFKALDILSKNEASDPQLIRSSQSTIGEAYIKLGDYEKALYHHEQAFDLTLKTYGEKSEYTYSSAINIASLYQSQSKYHEADEYIDLVLNSIDKGSNGHYLAVLNLQSNSEFENNNPEEGFRLLDVAISLTKSKGKDFTSQQIEILLKRAKKKLTINQLYDAKINLDEIKNILYLNDNEHSELHFAKKLYIQYHNLKGQLFLARFNDSNDQNQLLESHKFFSRAIEHYKELILDIGDQNTQFSLSKKADELLANATDVVYKLYKINGAEYLEDALNIIESGKNLALKKRLIENNRINSGNLPTELRAKEIKLNDDIAEIKKEINSAQIASSEDQYQEVLKLRSSLSEKLEERESLIEIYKNKFPKYFDLKFDDASISLRDITSNLSPGEAIVNFSLKDSLLYVLILNKVGNKFQKIDIPFEFTDIVQKFHSSISSTNTADYSSLLQQVSTILSPVFSELKSSQLEKLMIIPDGVLAYIPFEIILSEGNTTLGEKYEIYYSWSTKKIDNYINNHNPKSEILAVAPTYNDDNQVKVDINVNQYAELVRSGNVPLPGAEEEVDKIKAIYPTTSLKGAEASEAIFKAKSKDYNILHLSMHGLVDNQNPLLSSLVFTPEIDTIEDGLLQAWEIYNMDLNADLVVLSSCNTGYGKLEKTEGVMSLSRAFAHAGVPSAIMTLWQVPDQSTSEIMVNFYQYLKDGQTKSAALRNAKKAYLENTIVPQKKHPYYWAGLVLTGNNSPVKIQNSLSFWKIGIMAIIILLLTSYMISRMKEV